MSNTAEPKKVRAGIIMAWRRIPLYLRIVAAAGLGVLLGLWIGEDAAVLQPAGKLLLNLLGALAAPLILLAVVQAVLTTQVEGRTAAKLFYLLITNTLAAICIGLLVANLLRPGVGSDLPPPEDLPAKAQGNIVEQLLENVPRSIFGPLTDNGSIISVVMLALLFGFALRRFRDDRRIQSVKDFLDIGLQTLIVILHWVVDLLPFAVLCIVAALIGTQGFASFKALGHFIVAVLVALVLQMLFYLGRIRLSSWVRPWRVVVSMRDALFMAFSTASSTVTMPVTYEHLRTRVGVREESASMGAMVGANFNNDGTAHYEAMAALFVGQLLNIQLSLVEQIQVVLLSVVASVGAAGIPEAGLVTMVLVFRTVGLPPEYIAMLLPIDWFLDRCRTAVNVMGDVTVSCILDGKIRDPNVGYIAISSDQRTVDSPVER